MCLMLASPVTSPYQRWDMSLLFDTFRNIQILLLLLPYCLKNQTSFKSVHLQLPNLLLRFPFYVLVAQVCPFTMQHIYVSGIDGFLIDAILVPFESQDGSVMQRRHKVISFYRTSPQQSLPNRSWAHQSSIIMQKGSELRKYLGIQLILSIGLLI